MDPTLTAHLQDLQKSGATDDQMKQYIQVYQKQLGGGHGATTGQGTSLSSQTAPTEQSPTPYGSLPYDSSGTLGADLGNVGKAALNVPMSTARMLGNIPASIGSMGVGLAEGTARNMSQGASGMIKTALNPLSPITDQIAKAIMGGLSKVPSLAKGAAGEVAGLYDMATGQDFGPMVTNNLPDMQNLDATLKSANKGMTEDPAPTGMMQSMGLGMAGEMTGASALADAGNMADPMRMAAGVMGKGASMIPGLKPGQIEAPFKEGMMKAPPSAVQNLADYFGTTSEKLLQEMQKFGTDLNVSDLGKQGENLSKVFRKPMAGYEDFAASRGLTADTAALTDMAPLELARLEAEKATTVKDMLLEAGIPEKNITTGMVSNNQFAVGLEKMVSRSLGSSIFSKINGAMERVQQVAKDFASLPYSEDNATVGRKIAQQFQKSVDGQKDIEDALYQLHDEKLRASTKDPNLGLDRPLFEPTQTVDMMKQTIADLGESSMNPTTAAQVKWLKSNIQDMAPGSVGAPKNMTNFNSQYRNIFSEGTDFSPIGRDDTGSAFKNFKTKVATSLKSEMDGYLEQYDPETFKAVSAARGAHGDLMDVATGNMRDVINSNIDGKTPSGIVDGIIQPQYKDNLPELFKQLGPETTELIQKRYIQNLADASTFTEKGEDVINVKKFVSSFNKLDPEFKRIAFTPEQISSMQKLQTIDDAVQLGRQRNFGGSQTAYVMQDFNNLKDIAQTLFSKNPLKVIPQIVGSVGFTQILGTQSAQRFLQEGLTKGTLDFGDIVSTGGKGAVLNALFRHPAQENTVSR